MQVTITARFRGPAQSGNGGYTAGVLASAIEGAIEGDGGRAIEVTLKKHPPLDTPLTIVVAGAHASLRDGADEIASAQASPLVLDVPAPPTFDAAVLASRRYRGFESHPYPGCFVCGPERGDGDGLRIFAGKVDGHELVAAPLVVPAGPEPPIAFVWAALDCPGYFGAILSDEEIAPTLLLGKIHAEVLAPLHAGASYVVIGWPLGREGRKVFGATALFDEHGGLVARSRQAWIAPRPA